jgi:hypothetical protein
MSSYSREQILAALETVVETGVPTSLAARLLDVGSERYLSFFKKEIIDGILRPGGATCCFYEGAYGSGKTHLLHLLRHLAQQNDLLVAEVELSQNADFSSWHTVTNLILENLEFQTVNGAIKSVPRILDFLATKLDPSRFALKQFALPHVGFVNAMEIYLRRNRQLGDFGKKRLADYLMGQRITAGTLRRFGIEGVKNPLSQRNAEIVFNTVLSALYHLGFPTLILFDEIDQTFQNVRLNSRRVQEAANLVRRLIDACSVSRLEGVCMVFAVSMNFMSRCNAVYPALGDRVTIDRYFLETPNWRLPMVDLDTINDFRDQDEFTEQAVKRFCELADSLKLGDRVGKTTLYASAREVLLENAGSNFRRPLVRRLASELLRVL